MSLQSGYPFHQKSRFRGDMQFHQKPNSRKPMSVSIIIPVYNGSRHIAQCVRTLRDQTYLDWEAVFVNDGSTDNSLKMLKQAANEDARIRIVSQSNQGAAKARNAGIQSAKGDFITFLDIDDTLSKDFLENLLKEFTDDTDILVSSFNIIENGMLVKRKDLKEGHFTHIDYLKKVLSGHYGWELWGKMYRKSLFFKSILVPESIRIGEDASVFIQLITRARKITVTNKHLYNYIQYGHSVSHIQSSKYAEETLQAGYFIESFLKEEATLYPKIKDEIDAMFLLFYSNSTRRACLGRNHPLVFDIRKKHFNMKALKLLPLRKSIYITLHLYFGKYISKLLS